jgi:hypothetical protein
MYRQYKIIVYCQPITNMCFVTSLKIETFLLIISVRLIYTDNACPLNLINFIKNEIVL